MCCLLASVWLNIMYLVTFFHVGIYCLEGCLENVKKVVEHLWMLLASPHMLVLEVIWLATGQRRLRALLNSIVYFVAIQDSSSVTSTS